MTERVVTGSVISVIAVRDRNVLILKGGVPVISSDIIRGHLYAIILRLISEKDCYGYEIANEIVNRTRGEFKIKEASMYAVFQRLVKKELIETYLGDVSLGSRRRYYRITSLGTAYLKEEIRNWYSARAIIDIFIEGM